jgi:predicted nucleic acid-binding protein
MSLHDKTLKLVTNLDRAAIEARLASVRKAAQAAGLGEVVGILGGIEGAQRAQMEEKVKAALKALAIKPEHKGLSAQLELVEINLPNLK